MARSLTRRDGVLTSRMARPLTLARWGTDDANGAAADPDAAGVLTVLGRRRDRCGQAQVGPGNTQRPGRTRPPNAIVQRQPEPVSVNGHGRTAGWARPPERSRRVAGRIRLGCGAVRQSGRPKLGSTGPNHVSPFVRAEEGWLPAGQLRAGAVTIQGRRGKSRNS